MPEKTFERKDIVQLLAKLKEETPEYPTHLVNARKDSYLKQILEINISGQSQSDESGQGGGSEGPKGGSAGFDKPGGPGKSDRPAKPGGSSGAGGRSGSGRSGAVLSKGTASLGFGISLKSALVFGAIVVILTAAYIFRNQIFELLADSGLISQEVTTTPLVASSSVAEETETPTVIPPPDSSPPSQSSGLVATEASAGSGNNYNEGVPLNGGNSDPAPATPSPGMSQNPGTPTSPPSNGIVGRLRFLVCILRSSAESCE